MEIEPQIAVSGRNVYVVWSDDTPGNADIFFRASTDKGDDFKETKNLSDNDGFSYLSQNQTSRQVSKPQETQQCYNMEDRHT